MKKLIALFIAAALPALAVNPSFQQFTNTNFDTSGNIVAIKAWGSAVRYVSLTQPSDGNTNYYGPWTPGTKTSGIQEAINSLPVAASPNDRSKPGGGAIIFGPGIFWTSTNISSSLVSAQSNAFTLSLIGSGMTASCIVYSNTTPMETLTISRRGHGTLDNFFMENLGVFCVTNAMTNIVSLKGPNSGGADTFGGVARANIRFCYIGHWTRATNNPCWGFTPSSCGVDSNPNNLIALKVDCNFDDVITIEANSFNYVNGISVAADHMVVRDNMFEHCGITQNSAANDWPNTSIYRAGGAITVTEPGGSVNGSWDGVTAINGNKAWTFSGNNFVNCNRPYVIADQFNRDHFSISDDFENCGDTTRIVTTGSKWTFINMRSCAALKTYFVTNTALWNLAATAESTNSVYHVYIGGGSLSITNLGGGTTNAYGNIVGKPFAVYVTNAISATATAYTNALSFPASDVSTWLLCTNADAATKYVAGDRIPIEHVSLSSLSITGAETPTLSLSSSNIVLSVDAALTTSSVSMVPKGGGTPVAPSSMVNFNVLYRVEP